MTVIASEDFVRSAIGGAIAASAVHAAASFVAKTPQATFNQARNATVETATTEPLGANLNLDGAEDPTEALKVVQLRINDLEAFANMQAGLINSLVNVLKAAGLADG
jgi:hypothetical protein